MFCASCAVISSSGHSSASSFTSYSVPGGQWQSAPSLHLIAATLAAGLGAPAQPSVQLATAPARRHPAARVSARPVSWPGDPCGCAVHGRSWRGRDVAGPAGDLEAGQPVQEMVDQAGFNLIERADHVVLLPGRLERVLPRGLAGVEVVAGCLDLEPRGAERADEEDIRHSGRADAPNSTLAVVCQDAAPFGPRLDLGDDLIMCHAMSLSSWSRSTVASMLACSSIAMASFRRACS